MWMYEYYKFKCLDAFFVNFVSLITHTKFKCGLIDTLKMANHHPQKDYLLRYSNLDRLMA